MFTWLIHLVDLLILMGTCHVFRYLSRLVLPTKLRVLAEEFISTVDFCGCCFELAFICETYGTIPFAVALFVACYWWCQCFGDAAVNPNKHIEDYVRGSANLTEVGLKIGVELLAGKFVWSFVYFLWALELSPDHTDKSHEELCQADLVVPVWKGALVELVLTLIDRSNALISEDVLILQHNVYVSMLSTGLVVVGLDYSGGYFNPVLATSLKLGCKGHSNIEFFIVYWVASIIGSLIALEFYLLIFHRIFARKRSMSFHEKLK